MEKSSAGTGNKFKRLLILLVLTVTSVFSYAQDVKALMKGACVIPVSDFCFTEKSSEFNLYIESIEPKFVQFYIDKVPDSVNFISSQKIADTNGTLITIYFQFKKTGTFSLDPIVVDVKGYRFYVPFKQITVYENLDTLRPELMVDFSNKFYNREGADISIAAGEHIRFAVNMKYVVQILDFSYDLPKNSVFTEVKRYPVADGIPLGNTFSPEISPVVVFDWQPLEKGTWELPGVKITATSYNGVRYVIGFPEINVNVTDTIVFSDDSLLKKESVFAYAFSEIESSAAEYETKEISEEEINFLAQLRAKERNSLPFSKASRTRLLLEKERGFEENIREPNIPLLIFLICVFMIFTVMTAVYLRRKKYIKAAVLFSGALIALVFSIIIFVKASIKTALFKGDYLSPVPEQNVSTSVALKKGSYVQVTKKAGAWVYVKYNETYGWTKEENIIYIK